MESYQFFVGSLGEDYESFGAAVQQQDKEGGEGEGEREEEEEEDDLHDTHSRDALIGEVGSVHLQPVSTGCMPFYVRLDNGQVFSTD